MTKAITPFDPKISPPSLSQDNKYVWFNGVKYEVKFRSAEGKETIVNNKEILEKIVDILKAAEIEKSGVDLAKASLSQTSLLAEQKTIKEFKNTSFEKKVDQLFLNAYSSVVFKERLQTSQYKPKEEFDPQLEFPQLVNIGNSCFMDSTLELLLGVKEFIQAKLKEAELEKLEARQKKLILALREFFQGVQKGDSIKVALGQRKIYEILPSFPEFQHRGGQQDAPAFLNLILSTLNVTTPYKEIKTGVIKGSQSEKMEQIKHGVTSIMTAPIDVKRTHLGSILKLGSTVVENPDDEGNIDDIPCINRKSVTKLTMNEAGEPSDVIFVQLLRFDTKERKLNRPVDFIGENLKFDLSELFDQEALAGRKLEYKVVGIVNHIGRYGSGHYVAKVKHEKSEEWHLCDDLQQDNRHLNPGVKAFNRLDKQQVYMIALKRVPSETTSFA